ncbi:MAG: TIGR01459 family HAD-type hydrolase [Rhodospirillaceae bacterium]|nr:TIGR01459 family HAD-type hydrolase [Rhodospirillaceae bacterium]|tara:strand:- start:2725 stop:3591 length:867 start_codon:yes stop_codon:yes gene_type:complete
MKTIEIAGLGEIFSDYEVFIFDVWGTIYDGQTLLPETINILERLRYENKTVIFLSNSPQIASVVKKRLISLGIPEYLLHKIITSGDEAKRRLAKKTYPELKIFTGSVLLTGPNRYPNTIPQGLFTVTPNIKKANWIFNAGPDSPANTMEDYYSLLKEAEKLELPMLCTNPDKTVFHGTETHICAGALANYFQLIGGNVHYIGKPFTDIFDRCKQIVNDDEDSKFLMIGDNLETDILGANNSNFDSLLLGSGVHQLSRLPGGPIDHRLIGTLQKKFNSKATFVMGQLAW